MLVLLSVSAMIVVLALPQSSDERLEEAARSLQLRLQLLSDEALLSGRTFGLYIEENNQGYQWGQLTGDGWQEIEHRQVAPKTEFEDERIELKLGGEDASQSWFSDTLFEGDGALFETSSFEQEEQRFPNPQVWISASGEVTEARLVLFDQTNGSDEDSNWRVVILENGEIALLQPQQSLEEWRERQNDS